MARENDTKNDSAADPNMEDLTKQLEALRADMEGIGQTLKALGLSQGHAMAEELRERADRLRQKGEAEFAHVKDRAQGAVSEADRMVRDQPAMAMGLAAGFGFLIGLILARK
jgi:ElaB/YqjD/DUF883 family membrane-anchored ribosome-binding protein